MGNVAADPVIANEEQVLRVASLLSGNPLVRSEELCRRLGLPVVALVDAYAALQHHPDIHAQWMLSRHGDFFRVATQVLSRRDVVEKILADEFVFPLFVEFHSGGTCPIQCTFCYNDHVDHFKTRTSRAEMLDEAAIVRIVDEAADEGTLIFYIAGGGEPLSDPRIWAPLARARARGLVTILNTMGGHLLRAHTADKILASVDQIRISLNTASPEAYRLVSRTRDDRMFHRVVEGVHTLVKARDAAASGLRITMSFVVVPDNWREIEAMASLGAAAGVDEVYIRKSYDGAQEPAAEVAQAFDEAVAALRARELAGAFGRTRLNLGTAIEAERADTPFHAAISASDCMATRVKIGIDAWGNVHRCSLVAQPGVGDFKFSLGSVAGGAPLRPILERAYRAAAESVAACNAQGIYCSNFESYLNGLLTKLRRDQAFGVPLAAQPFFRSESADCERWFARRN